MNFNVDSWQLAERLMSYATRVLLYGPPGTGKTTVATTVAVEGRQVFNITTTEETPAAEIRGHYLPKARTGFVWHDGPAVMAWRLENSRLVINEIDHASGDLLTLLFAICDDPEVASLTLPTGEMVKPQPGFQVVATTNGSPDMLPEGLADRFNARVHLTMPHPKAMAKLPIAIRRVAEPLAVHKDESRRVTLRQWYSFVALSVSMSEEEAALAAFGTRGAEILGAIVMSRQKGSSE